MDEPECGYQNEKCKTETTDVRLILLKVLSSSVLFLILVSIIQYYQWKYEQKILGLSWKINIEELKLISNGWNLSRVRTVQQLRTEYYYVSFSDFCNDCRIRFPADDGSGSYGRIQRNNLLPQIH